MVSIVKGFDDQIYQLASSSNMEETFKDFWEIFSAKVKEMEPLLGQWDFGAVTEVDLELLKLGSFVLPQSIRQGGGLRYQELGREDNKIRKSEG